MVTWGTGEPEWANCALANSTSSKVVFSYPKVTRGVKDEAHGTAPALEIVTVAAGEALLVPALLYSTTLSLLLLATQRSPEESKMRSVGSIIPLVSTRTGRMLPVAAGR